MQAAPGWDATLDKEHVSTDGSKSFSPEGRARWCLPMSVPCGSLVFVFRVLKNSVVYCK